MGYCFMNTQKIKSMGTLASKYRHNFRLANVENADPALADQNEILVALPNDSGTESGYEDAVRERIASIPYYQTHKVRRDAVQAIEVLTTFSHGEDVDVEEWKRRNVEWLEKTFNVAGDGKRNVMSVVYHADEPGQVHCHAMIIPIDERGRLNATRFLNGSRKLSDLQTSYASSMAPLGLIRGVEGSGMKHEEIRRMYARMNHAMQPAPVREGETAQEYQERVKIDMRTRRAVMEKQYRDKQRRLQEEFAAKRNAEREALSAEYASSLRAAELAGQHLQSEEKRLSKVKQEADKEGARLQELLSHRNAASQKIAFSEELAEKYSILRERDPELASELLQRIQEIRLAAEQYMTKDNEDIMQEDGVLDDPDWPNR